MKNLNHADKPRLKKSLTEEQGFLTEVLTYTGMRSDAIFAVINGLKTPQQGREMIRGLWAEFQAKNRLPTHEEVMLGMLSIRRTGKFSLTAWAEPTGRNTTRKTRRYLCGA